MQKIVFVLTALLLAAITAHATVHEIQFSGRKYTPKTLSVTVGDTIVWVGDFDKHPLSLTKAPAGAARFEHIEKGSRYQYVVTLAGNYDYICDDHVDEGMSGSFSASPVAGR